MYRESVGVRAPSLCGLQQSTGDVLLATVHRHTANRPTSHPHHVAIPSFSLQWNRPPLSSGIWEIPIQFAFRQMRQQPRQTRHERQQARYQREGAPHPHGFPGAEGWTKRPGALDRRPSPAEPSRAAHGAAATAPAGSSCSARAPPKPLGMPPSFPPGVVTSSSSSPAAIWPRISAGMQESR